MLCCPIQVSEWLPVPRQLTARLCDWLVAVVAGKESANAQQYRSEAQQLQQAVKYARDAQVGMSTPELCAVTSPPFYPT